MKMLYSRETRRGHITQYHGYILAPDDVTLTTVEADCLLEYFISTSANNTIITAGVVSEGTIAEPGVYIGSGVYARKLADLVVQGAYYPRLCAVSNDGEEVLFVKDIKREGSWER